MLALHGVWDSDRAALVLWAEDGAGPAGAGVDGKAKAPPGRRPPLHPFAAPHASIANGLDALGSAIVQGAVAVAVPCTVTIRLPGRPRVPDDSPLLVRVDGGATGRGQRARRAERPSLWPFDVPALRFAPSPALDVLLALTADDASRLHPDASLGALGLVAELALEVVAAGRVVPGFADGPRGAAVACWEPLRLGRDADRLAALAAALPPAACSLTDVHAPDAVVGNAFGAFVDAVCRESLRRPIGRTGARATASAALDAWLRALGGPVAEVPADPIEVAALRRLVDEWRAPLLAPGGSWRLCFRLHEPDGRADAWRVDLLLQAADDPSLIVDAAEVWRAGDVLQRAARTLESPQEVFLAELGRAVRAFPELEPALAEPAPTTVVTDLDGAHRFLSEVAPALELAGFGVLLPSWWLRASPRLGVRLRVSRSERPTPSGTGRFTVQGLASFDWEAALDGEPLALDDLRRLATLKAPLVRVRGQWMELDPREAERLLEFLSNGRRRRTLSILDAVRAASGSAPLDAGVPVVAVEADGVLGALLRGDLADALEVRPTPVGFRGELRPYQRRGVAWIELLERVGMGACLADDMGLGKTATVLGVLESERSEGVGEGPTLVVCPTSVVGNWRREVERFAPDLRVVVHHGAARPRGDALRYAVAGADVVVTSYALVERDRGAIAAIPWRRLVLDEAQQVKNPAARQTRAVRAIPAPRRIALSGTPVENHLGELWSIMEILNPGLLGSERTFRERFAVPIERYGDERALAQLRALTRPFILRRLKTDRSIISDLPEKLEMKVRCALSREQASLYQAVVDEMLAKIAGAEGIERRGLVLATMLRLKQVCNHPAQYIGDGSALAGRSGKLERTVEILDQVRAAREKAVVFTQFAEMGALLQRHLAERLGCRVAFLHGGVPRVRRDEMVAGLQAPGGAVSVMVLSLKAGGTGLNLTAANHVVHYDRWWNPAVEDQASDRAYRIGQRRDVQVRKLVCAGTVEDRIDDMIETKRDLAARTVGTGEGWLTELSTDELADVLRLSAGAGDEA